MALESLYNFWHVDGKRQSVGVKTEARQKYSRRGGHQSAYKEITG
jgi:hypothetical protein